MASKKGGNKSDVLEVKMDTSLSAEDLAAEIAATASAVGESKTVKGKSVKTETKRRTRTKKASTAKKTKAAPKKAAKKVASKPKVTSASESSGVAVTVANPPKPKPVIAKKVETVAGSDQEVVTVKTSVAAKKTPKLSQASESSAVSVKIAPKPLAKKPTLTVLKKKPSAAKGSDAKTSGPTRKPTNVTRLSKPLPKRAPVLNKHGKDIRPFGDIKRTSPAQPAAHKKVLPIETEVARMAMDDGIRHAVVDDQSHEEPVSVHASAPKDEPKVEVIRRKRHVARIYDTHTYHMPIEVNYHTRKAATPRWGRWLIAAVAVAGMAVAAVLTDILSF